MKVILRNTATDLYVLGPKMWTNDPNRAMDFGYTGRAMKLAEETGLKEIVQDMELILSFSGFNNALHVPLKTFGSNADQSGMGQGR